MLAALERAVMRKTTAWTTDRELQASQIELTHMTYLLLARANGAKKVGKPLRVPRPDDKPAAPLSPREVAQQYKR